ncbi:MAG: hypothetical protein KA968_12890 [Chitinophagaceae bacterium]|nr:hypothetical protein [Chitinophagaceae bacterium]
MLDNCDIEEISLTDDDFELSEISIIMENYEHELKLIIERKNNGDLHIIEINDEDGDSIDMQSDFIPIDENESFKTVMDKIKEHLIQCVEDEMNQNAIAHKEAIEENENK